jgi:hypothetical protein
VADPTITDKPVTATVVEPTTPGPLPGVDPATMAKLDAIEVDLRGGYVRSGEHIAEDPDEFRDEQFVNVADLPSIIRAWALAAVPHLADQPATTGDQDEVTARLRQRLRTTENSLRAMEKMNYRILRALGWPEHVIDPEPPDVLAGIARLRQSADRDTNAVRVDELGRWLESGEVAGYASVADLLNAMRVRRDWLAQGIPADRDTETAALRAEPQFLMGTKPDGSPWVISAEFARTDVRVDAYGVLRLHGKAVAPAEAHKLAVGLLSAITWLENDGIAKTEYAASLGGEQA